MKKNIFFISIFKLVLFGSSLQCCENNDFLIGDDLNLIQLSKKEKPMKSLSIVPYDSDWPMIFKKEADHLQKSLGDNVIDIHHVGSTSVPDLWAKPVIDINSVVKNGFDTIQPLEALGYVYKGEYNIPFRYFFIKEGNPKIHLHIYTPESSEIELNLLFRNYLRDHPETGQQYVDLKKKLVEQYDSFKKENSSFKEYTLGKYSFIQKVLHQAGFNKIRLLRCTHDLEWKAARAFRQKYFFDKVPMDDPYTWTFNHPDHVHFVLYQGTSIIGYAHIQLWPEACAALRIIVIEETYRGQKYGDQFLKLCERWLKQQGFKSFHTESSPQAFPFYQKQGYVDMPFDDPDGYESDPQDIPLGKIL